MELNEYQKKALQTAMYDKKYKVIYPALGLGSEAGEVLGGVKKWLNSGDDNQVITEDCRNRIKSEMGDALWYLAVLAEDLGFSLDEVAVTNITKLQLRKEKGALLGDVNKR